MSKKMEIVKHYLVPIFIILAVFGCCTFFLLENIPHSADDLDVNYSSKRSLLIMICYLLMLLVKILVKKI